MTRTTIDVEYSRGRLVGITEHYDRLWLEIVDHPFQELKELTEVLMKVAHKGDLYI